MTSVFATALGADYHRLHPMLQRRFGVGLTSGYACVGTGVMSTVRRGPWWTLPFLHLGAVRNILFPDQGRDVPFTIENYPYLDPYGRETVTFVREYHLGSRARRFDATMIAAGGRLIDYLGTHQHLAVDLELTVEPDGSLSLRSAEQRFYEGRFVAFRFPRLLTGDARLRESFDDDAQVYRIDVEVRNPVLGFLFGYRGTFTCEFPAAADAPARLKPRRHERRL
jgi:hypothetical protein